MQVFRVYLYRDAPQPYELPRQLLVSALNAVDAVRVGNEYIKNSSFSAYVRQVHHADGQEPELRASYQYVGYAVLDTPSPPNGLKGI